MLGDQSPDALNGRDRHQGASEEVSKLHGTRIPNYIQVVAVPSPASRPGPILKAQAYFGKRAPERYYELNALRSSVPPSQETWGRWSSGPIYLSRREPPVRRYAAIGLG